ncbi:Uncharacterised protein [uncultured archaeon]|nr:Uncharacterised protein [uncultured archaeon]
MKRSKKLFLLFAFLPLIFLFSNLISAGIIYNSPVSNGLLNVTISFNSYSPFVYFYNSTGNNIQIVNLGCGNNCSGAKTFFIPLASSNFSTGNYSFSVYVNDFNNWQSYNLTIIPSSTIYSTNTPSNSFSPNFCCWAKSIFDWGCWWSAEHCGYTGTLPPTTNQITPNNQTGNATTSNQTTTMNYTISNNQTSNFTTCTPKTCLEIGKTCGSWSNGCSSNLDCGTCPSGQQCIYGQCINNCLASRATCSVNSDCCNGLCKQDTFLWWNVGTPYCAQN